MKFKPSILNDSAMVTTEVRYVIAYGTKRESDRKSECFSTEKAADKFFKEQEAAGKYVDAYKITSVVTKEKLT